MTWLPAPLNCHRAADDQVRADSACPADARPKRQKVVFLTWLGIYPVILALSLLLPSA